MRPDKRLGQHFLRDVDVLQDIAAIADVGTSSGVLEIGPGEGALTAFLVASGKPVVALDVDPRAIAALSERFGDKVRGVLGDATETDLGPLLPPPDDSGRRAVIVGNLPYNAASPIFRRLLRLGPAQVSRMVLMFQKEVAVRIAATPGSKAFGVPSVMTSLVARAHVVAEVPPAAFYPRPKVDSAVVLVELLDTPRFGFDRARLDAFGRWLPTLFQHRRKKLRHATVALSDLDAAAATGVDLALRPEQLDIADMIALFDSQRR